MVIVVHRQYISDYLARFAICKINQNEVKGCGILTCNNFPPPQQKDKARFSLWRSLRVIELSLG